MRKRPESVTWVFVRKKSWDGTEYLILMYQYS